MRKKKLMAGEVLALAVCVILTLTAIFILAGDKRSFQLFRSPQYEQFQSELHASLAIQVSPPEGFSVRYPEPITAPKLLESAREKLLSSRPPSFPESLYRWSEEDISQAYQITLTFPTGKPTSYLLYQPGGLAAQSGGKNQSYVLSSTDFSVVSVLNTYAAQALIGVADQQNQQPSVSSVSTG